MKYKNTKTGFVFESKTKVEGADWEEVKTPSKQTSRKKNTTKPKKEDKE